MWIVRLALDRPYTFVVLALLLLITGPLVILRTPVDIFPTIGIPVVATIWSYTGLVPEEMADRIVATYERSLTVTVNDIEHIESQSLNGIAVVKTYFQPTVQPAMAVAQTTAIAQTQLRSLPPGTTPPFIAIFNASSVPIMQLTLSSNTLSEQELNDAGNNTIRTQLATVQGAVLPYPYGGKQREVVVDLNEQKLQALGLSAQDVNTAIGNQNLIVPTGTEKIGEFEYNIKLNASPQVVDELNDVPIKVVNGSMVYIRDVAHVRDGFAPQTNVVRVDGKRAVLMTILKSGNSSTLDIIAKIKERMPLLKGALPASLDLSIIGDQSVFVKAAIVGVVREGVIAAVLTALMILLFLGNWRSTVIIIVSIPLSIIVSLLILAALGETINIMTLGGLALAVGILVDDGTVEIENTNAQLERGKEVKQAILDSAAQIAVPALVSTTCICIVFLPMFFLTGVARYLFVPLAEAVVFAMIASYFLSRTLVPTMANYLLKKHEPHQEGQPRGRLARFQAGFEQRFEALRLRYRGLLEQALKIRGVFILCFLAFVLVSIGALAPWLGSNFFPVVDAGQIKLHLRAHTGMRVEETSALCDAVDQVIHDVIPAGELDSVTHNIGLPYSGINTAYSNSAPVGPEDADIYISLKEDHKPTADYTRKLRTALNQQLPGVLFVFLPADITSQILNFGLPASIDVQVRGNDFTSTRQIANKLLAQITRIPGIVDPRIQQPADAPEFRVNVDRTRAEELGLTQKDIASDLLISLSGSFQTSPTFWLDPKNGVSYNIVTQTPQYAMTSLEDLRNIPLNSAENPTAKPQILGAVATIDRGTGPAIVSHYNVQPLIDIYASVQDRDLGSVSDDVVKIVSDTIKQGLPKGVRVKALGQMQTMRESFNGLYFGLLGAIVLVYFLIVVNFQSWTDPFIIITALPGAIAGIVWMLFLTHTTLSVPALTGAIMCMGVATSNSILVVSFARERMDEGDNALTAALEAGFGRLRPVMMTALAMIIGMLPMALGFGEGGEQNAPLGRAVIGGLLMATGATLFFVPAVFCFIHGRREARSTAKSNDVSGTETP